MLSMKCISMLSLATYSPIDWDPNPGWFSVWNSNQKLSVMNNASMWYSSKYCKLAIITTLLVVINSHLRMHLQIWRLSMDVHYTQLVYLTHRGSCYPTPLTERYCTGWIRRMLNGGEPSKH